jgi:hypothetical protein
MTTTAAVTKFAFACGSHVIPHPAKRKKGGEDSHLLSSHAIAVADGVSSWSKANVDPALFAISLMEGARRSLQSHPLGHTDPFIFMKEAFYFAMQV